MASAPPSNCSGVLIRTWTMQPGLRKTHARVTLQFKIKAKKRRGKWHLRLEITMYKCLKTSPLLATNLDTCLEKEIVNCLWAGRKVLRVDGTTLNGHRHVFWSAAVKCPSPEIFVACFSFLKWHWMSLYECFGLRPKCLRAICPSTCRMRRSHDAKCDLDHWKYLKLQWSVTIYCSECISPQYSMCLSKFSPKQNCPVSMIGIRLSRTTIQILL